VFALRACVVEKVQGSRRLTETDAHAIQPLEFVLNVNGKTYRYETEMPTSLQAAFLVTAVRCWRRYMAGACCRLSSTFPN
jgi:hypothetical protein